MRFAVFDASCSQKKHSSCIQDYESSTEKRLGLDHEFGRYKVFAIYLPCSSIAPPGLKTGIMTQQGSEIARGGMGSVLAALDR